MTAFNILVVEDQKDISDLIAVNLQSLNYDVHQCHDGLKGLELAQNNHYDAIILDIMLPGIDGLQICQILRSQKNLTPVLMLTAKKSEAERVIGLEMGADDYLTKPFSVLELQARVKAQLRRSEFNRSQSATPDILAFKLNDKELKLSELKRQVTLCEKNISLTQKEFDLLIYLAKNPGNVFSREQLLDHIWGYHHSGYEHTVNSHINRLRSKIEADPANPVFVHTVWGVGYKFNEQATSH